MGAPSHRLGSFSQVSWGRCLCIIAAVSTALVIVEDISLVYSMSASFNLFPQ